MSCASKWKLGAESDIPTFTETSFVVIYTTRNVSLIPTTRQRNRRTFSECKMYTRLGCMESKGLRIENTIIIKPVKRDMTIAALRTNPGPKRWKKGRARGAKKKHEKATIDAIMCSAGAFYEDC